MDHSSDMQNMLDDLVRRARKAGADQADGILTRSVALAHARRLDRVERLERAESRDLGLRVIIGQKQAVASGNDWRPAALDELVARAVAMARAVPDDPWCGLAPAELCARPPFSDIDAVDPVEPSTECLIARAQEAEDAARAVPGVTNSEGAEAEWGHWHMTLVASNGFCGGWEGSRHTLAVQVLAGEGTAMESDYDYSVAVHGADLKSPALIGKTAGERAVAALNPGKPPSTQCPVVFDPRIAGGLIGTLAGAINGAAIARGTSFLKDAMESRVMAKGLDVIDDPHRPRGLKSKPFDAEGVANGRRYLVRDGILRSWILDLGTARQLKLQTTGHAARGTGGPPSPSASNVHLAPGTLSPAELMADIGEGIYVTSLMGHGINMVTGDYSRGAAGFRIEKGERAGPVSELTIAGNLAEMFRQMTPADDLEFTDAVNAPTLRIDGMTVAGA